MTDFLIYDLKVSAVLTVCYLFYRLLLERETLHRLSRLVLLASLALSLLLPLFIITIHHTVWVEAESQAVNGTALSEARQPADAALLQPGSVLELLLSLLFVAGFMVRLYYLARSYWQLRRLMNTGQLIPLPYEGIRLCIVDVPVAPFSWGHTVVVNRQDYNERNPLLLIHERSHVRLHHSCDVVFVELITALQWFNPVVWLLSRDLRTIHEYEADEAVLSQGADLAQYISLLACKATGIQACALANPIKTSKLKKRIDMMLKHKSPRLCWLKGLYILPVAALSLALTAKTVTDYRILPAVGHPLPVISVGMPESQDPICEKPDQQASFPGGEAKLFQFLAQNTVYPKECTDSGVQGRVVVSMTIERDGSLSQFKVLKSAAPLLDEEALRVIKLMPRWLPAKKDGKSVRSNFVFPVTFRLQ